jgi:hypothetical protein
MFKGFEVKQDFTPFVYFFMVETAGVIYCFRSFPVYMGAVSVDIC